MTSRQERLDRVRANPALSVLIIGAGVNGIGTFRDLALQGVDVLIVDRDDFCSGASMASSHMLHGGIRYLENGEFRLVREALRERNRLLRNAPHLTGPLPTTIPIFKWFSGLFNAPLKFLGLLNRPAERGLIVIKIGLMVYDWFVRGDSHMPEHRVRNRRESLTEWPDLNPDVKFTATYYDGATPSPERICVELLADGEAEGPHATALNYVSAVGAADGSVELRDELTGDVIRVKPQIVVNAAGPWIDFTNGALGRDTGFIGGTKGSHIILNHPKLRAALGNNQLFFEYFDGRIVFVYPYLDKPMIGSTDIPVDDPDQARCTDEEINYMLNMVPKIFPHLDVRREHIIFQFCGVRPLPTADVSFTGQISRDHSIRLLEAGNGTPYPILSLIGGKWTTYRAFAEQVTDAVLSRLDRPRQASTADLPIGGGRDYPADTTAQQAWIAQTTQQTGLDAARIGLLFERYGTGAAAIAATCAESADAPLTHHPGYTQREVEWLAAHEQIVHLDDFILRRSLLAWMGEVSREGLVELGSLIGGVAGWDTARQAAEVERAASVLSDRHGISV